MEEGSSAHDSRNLRHFPSRAKISRMDTQALNVFEGLIYVAERLDKAANAGAALTAEDVEATVWEVYALDAVEEMILSAAARLASRYGLALFRLDVEDGKPSFVLSLGKDDAEARARLATYYERQKEDQRLGLA